MRKYFATVLEEDAKEMTCMEANMYLAEDRIMCFNIFAMKGKKYTLKYVEDAKAWTDVMDSIIRLINQRRRWSNGSWFAALHVLDNTLEVTHSKHSAVRTTFFYILTTYNIISTILSYVSISLFYVLLKTSVYEFCVSYLGETDTNSIVSYNVTIMMFFNALLLTQIYLSLTYRVNDIEVKPWYMFLFVIMGLYTYFSYYVMGYFVYYNYFVKKSLGQSFMEKPILEAIKDVDNVIWSVLGGIFSYTVPVFLNYKKFFRLYIIPFLSFTFYMPIFMIVIPIYSFCNFDDVSWGTRSDAADKSASQKALTSGYRLFKAQQVAIWILTNLIAGYSLLYILNSNGTNRDTVIHGLSYLFTLTLVFKAICACIYKLREVFVPIFTCKRCRKKKQRIEPPIRVITRVDSRA
eukprot:TRINITY_DN2365_c0_g1_i2.p1 TRINITY_DN2365_c0_g1~~TRINITY_DN2365_c0_g1_i2.p1  ORF type:complete len:406 (-),score=95.83 TRINITY_DN2365_c0_g1_i2:97-1314(-)